jgi:hypothetical protein
MSNTITIELCSEDRARLDRLAEALERKTCDKCVATAMEFAKLRIEPKPETDPVQQALAETLARATETVEAPKNAPEEAEPSTQTTTPPEEEKPTGEEPTPAPTTKAVDRAELRAKVIELSAKGLKEQTKDIVRAYAQTVTAVPEDKVAECYAKLVALEG